ncbi:MAG TPA: transporter substrate-binding domain-containing protein [Alphaproteobacteria bacterium]|nr:transporter substrate-binding domain-containing protein [Alphaproteobacteria bacterium]
MPRRPLSLLFGLLLLALPVRAEEVRLMTEVFPPFNYMADNQLTGLSVEVVRAMAARLGHPGDVEVLPWSRAVALLDSEPGRGLFSMARTPAREAKYRWVGPIAETRAVFMGRKDARLRIDSLDAAREVGLIGVMKDTPTEKELRAAGFANLDVASDHRANPKKLESGRIALWVTGEFSGAYRAREAGVDPSQFEPVYVYAVERLYLALSKDTPDAEVERWQGALESLRADGGYDAIVKRYLP